MTSTPGNGGGGSKDDEKDGTRHAAAPAGSSNQDTSKSGTLGKKYFEAKATKKTKLGAKSKAKKGPKQGKPVSSQGGIKDFFSSINGMESPKEVLSPMGPDQPLHILAIKNDFSSVHSRPALRTQYFMTRDNSCENKEFPILVGNFNHTFKMVWLEENDHAPKLDDENENEPKTVETNFVDDGAKPNSSIPNLNRSHDAIA